MLLPLVKHQIMRITYGVSEFRILFLPRGNFVAALKIRDRSIVTSGIYERSHTVDGKTYHHIFNRKTGYPIESALASITIISDRSVDGEIWTTRLFGKKT